MHGVDKKQMDILYGSLETSRNVGGKLQTDLGETAFEDMSRM
jgi:hypothetical protein